MSKLLELTTGLLKPVLRLLSMILVASILLWLSSSGKVSQAQLAANKDSLSRLKQEEGSLLGTVLGPADNSVNIMFSTGSYIGVHTQREVWLPAVVEVPRTEEVRDIVVDDKAKLVYIYNGTFEPSLTIYDRIQRTWTHKAVPGWSTVNVVSYGGIARFQNYIFLTDMSTGGGGETSGVIRYDLEADSFVLFADGSEPIDLTIGLDNLLYVLINTENIVNVYDPATNNMLRTFTLDRHVRGIAINSSGEVFGASFIDHKIYHFDSNGALLNSVSSPQNPGDIDIHPDGLLIVASRFGEATLIDESLTILNSFNVNGEHVAFTSYPTLTTTFLPTVSFNYCPNFFDDFSDPTSGWSVTDNSFVRTEYLDGEYRILSKQGGFIFLFRAPACSRQNYTVAADVRWVGTPGNSYGLLFGITDSASQFFNQYYLFDINTDFRLYRLLQRNPDGSFSTIISPSPAPAINNGSEVNHLKVTRIGDQITLEVNATWLATISDSSITGLTDAGVVSSSYTGTPTSDARFDNFDVTQFPAVGSIENLNQLEAKVYRPPSSWQLFQPVNLNWD